MNKKTVMLDSNIIISTVIFKNSKLAKTVLNIVEKHDIILSNTIIEEVRRVISLKWPDAVVNLETFLKKLTFKLVRSPNKIVKDKYPKIRDTSDYPVLAGAIISDVDVFITGDKDFLELKTIKPKILTVSEFEKEYL